MKVANYKLDGYFARLEPVQNYNGSIVAERAGSLYVVRHWGTAIAAINFADGDLELMTPYVSQTTSVLLGRIIRSLPQGWVARSVRRDVRRGVISDKRAKQVLAMIH